MDQIEIPPARRWVVFSLLAAGVWWVAVIAVGLAAWPWTDLGGKALIAWVALLSLGFTALIATRWGSLSLIADASEIRFGKRVVMRADVASIAIEPVGDTAVRFWSAVAIMAITQDLSRTIAFRAASGRSLLTTTDLYGSDQLARLAEFLHVPLVGERRRVR